jgi:hypothetical protein
MSINFCLRYFRLTLYILCVTIVVFWIELDSGGIGSPDWYRRYAYWQMMNEG